MEGIKPLYVHIWMKFPSISHSFHVLQCICGLHCGLQLAIALYRLVRLRGIESIFGGHTHIVHCSKVEWDCSLAQILFFVSLPAKVPPLYVFYYFSPPATLLSYT